MVPHDHEWYIDSNGHYTESHICLEPNFGFHAPNSDDNNKKNKKNDTVETVTKSVGTIITSYALYQGVKWVVAGLLSILTGGTSIIVAGVTP